MWTNLNFQERNVIYLKNQVEIVALKKCDTKIEAFTGYVQQKTEYNRRID